MSITLAQLKQQSRERADMVNNDFISDSELTSYINSSIAELHDIMIQCYGSDYNVLSVTTTLTSGVAEYSIATLLGASNFYKLSGIDAKINTDEWHTVSPINFNERNRFQRLGVLNYLGVTSFKYRLVGSKIIFAPTPAAYQIRIWYIPTATKLVNSSDSLDDLNQYAEYVIVDAAIKMMQKEESDVSVLAAQKAALKRRIEEAANNRDAGKPDAISDIYAENDFYWY